ncbi:hypothetical protein AAZX31_02G198500 [Glycine max]|uniref:J domain-containing protein n=2 Tax=Glycine subgen. Soja TaxID=1462606 RepID=C6SXB3_SOYBN|nr:uncharacterized protein LOC100808904 [Glycine max]XP_028212842.1 uncharacterized protein LOC114395299 isoform X1 [Glycine soja]ACU13886.1 unknown [Glycine max]KAH1061428.1 hypothetical protein GYH30_004761 [Glycine max]KRH72437.1 hypothetical protein GLYMA_02G212500v4 [Glycine max]RZC26040.1 Chaperone protein DnaJ isoform A [Glycine soja]|eukprot:NP_001242691.1 uncharacterized protein LOC100808904 [Glycine max]
MGRLPRHHPQTRPTPTRFPPQIRFLLRPLQAQGPFSNFSKLGTVCLCNNCVLCWGQDYYKILEVDYDATDDAIRSNYIRLALKWHPDKHKDQNSATSRFQDINEAYQVLSDPVKRREYDINGMRYEYDYNIIDYLNRYKGLILTCNGLGIKHSIW